MDITKNGWTKVSIAMAAVLMILLIPTNVVSAQVNANIFYNFDVQDDFENLLFNNGTYLTIPTYDGSGQAIHPDIYYNASGWHGYKYWMAMTPYPNGDNSKENPSIVTSNDGYNWVVPSGLTNPIVIPTSGYDSDPNLAFKNGTLYLYYREKSNGFDRLKIKSSTNGITWSPEQTALELPNYQLIAPAVVYNSADNLFYLWYVDTGILGSQATSTQVILRNSNDGIHWNSPQIVQISIPDKIIWHINTEYIPELNEYWMVISAGTGAAGYKTELYFASSIDKLNWNVLPGKILGSSWNWDTEIYQSAIKYIDNKVKIWYSAVSDSGTWHTGYSETSLTDLKKDYHWEYYNKVGDFYRNSLQVKNGQYSAMLKFDGSVNEYVDVRRKVSNGQNMSFEIDFYDDGNTTGMKLFRVVNNINEMVGIGVWSDVSSGFYSYHNKIYTYKITSIQRKVGWHKFRISIQNDKSSTFYIDDINVGKLSSQFNDPVYVQLSSGFYKGVFYVDNLNVYQNSDPIASITNLTNISYALTYINWTWTDPIGPGFDHVEVYIDNSFKENVPKAKQFYNATGFNPGTGHTISTRTSDTNGNVNNTWVNATARTLPSGAAPVAVCGPDKPKCENVGAPVQFNGSASYDPDGAVVSYYWDFGDGTNITGAAPKHMYALYKWNGTAYEHFIVNFTVTDNSGLINNTSQKVVIWIAGDANGDGNVNILDASMVGLKWNGNDPCADLNNDGNVNILDASIIELNWGKIA